MKRIHKFTGMILAVISIMIVNIPVYAAYVDTAHAASLTILYQYETTPLPDGPFKVYQIADLTSDWLFVKKPEFSEVGEPITNMTAEKWTKLTTDLEAFINGRTDLAPMETGVTAADGKLKFAEVTKTGLYLVTGESHKIDRYTYTPESFLVVLPSNLKNPPEYDVTSIVKVSRVEDPTEPPTKPDPPTEPETTTVPETTRPSGGGGGGGGGGTGRSGFIYSGGDPVSSVTDTPSSDTPQTSDTEVLGASRDLEEIPKKEVLGSRRLPKTGTYDWTVPYLIACGGALIAFGFLLMAAGIKKDEE